MATMLLSVFILVFLVIVFQGIYDINNIYTTREELSQALTASLNGAVAGNSGADGGVIQGSALAWNVQGACQGAFQALEPSLQVTPQQGGSVVQTQCMADVQGTSPVGVPFVPEPSGPVRSNWASPQVVEYWGLQLSTSCSTSSPCSVYQEAASSSGGMTYYSLGNATAPYAAAIMQVRVQEDLLGLPVLNYLVTVGKVQQVYGFNGAGILQFSN